MPAARETERTVVPTPQEPLQSLMLSNHTSDLEELNVGRMQVVGWPGVNCRVGKVSLREVCLN